MVKTKIKEKSLKVRFESDPSEVKFLILFWGLVRKIGSNLATVTIWPSLLCSYPIPTLIRARLNICSEILNMNFVAQEWQQHSYKRCPSALKRVAFNFLKVVCTGSLAGAPWE